MMKLDGWNAGEMCKILIASSNYKVLKFRAE